MEYVCEVGDIFEYPETGEYEKLRGERIVVLEKGKGWYPVNKYVRVLSFRPNAENDSFHFSCHDRYIDKVLEHWRFVGHMDISMITNPEKFTETWSGQAECDVRDKVRTADDVRYFVKRSMHNATSCNGMWTLHYISRLLTLIYESGMKYDVECLFFDIVDYARSACYPEDLTRALKIISQMPFASNGERFEQPSFQSVDDAMKLIDKAKAYIAMGGRFMVKDLRDLTEVRISAFTKLTEYCYGWDQSSLFDDTLIYEDPDESGVYRICIPAPRRLKPIVTKNDLAQKVKVGADQIDRVQIGEDTIEFETVDKNIRELQKENESLKEEIDILKKKIEQHENDNDIWRQGWYDCLKSLGTI